MGPHHPDRPHHGLLSLRRLGHRIVACGPGALLCALVALAATALSAHLGGPALLYALLLGMGLNMLADHDRFRPGVDLCAKAILRLGVALLGARITTSQIAELGWQTAVVVLVGVLSTIALGVWLVRRLGRPLDEGLISGGSVGICGASAALAVASVLPDTRENQRFTVLCVAGVTLLSTVAMVVYPVLASMLGWSPVHTGVLLGGTIHDVAQVVASASMVDSAGVSAAAGGQGDAVGSATVVKLFRVMMLVPIIMVLALLVRRLLSTTGPSGPDAAMVDTPVPILPGFLVAFVVLVLLNSSGALPTTWVGATSDVSRACLVLAIAAAGIRTEPADFRQLGWLPVLVLVLESLWLLALVMLSRPLWG